MKKSSKILKKASGSKLEIISADGDRNYTYILYKKGDAFLSIRDIHEDQLDDLVDTFENNEDELTTLYRAKKASDQKPEYILIGILFLIAIYSIYRSNFDFKLILLIVPVVIVITYRTLKKVGP